MRSVNFWRSLVALVAAIQVVEWGIGSRLPAEAWWRWLVVGAAVIVGWLAFYDAVGGEMPQPAEKKAE